MRGRIDPNYLQQCLKDVQGRVYKASPRFARKFEAVDSVIKEDERLSLKIEELSKNIQTESIFMSNASKAISALENDCENLENENKELQEKIMLSTFKQSSINAANGNSIFDGVVKGVNEKTPLIKFIILKTLLIEQKTRLAKAQEIYRDLNNKCFCLDDTSDFNDYLIDDSEKMPEIPSFSHVFAERMIAEKSCIPEIYTSPCEVASDDISSIPIDIKDEENDGGIQFNVVPQMSARPQSQPLLAIEKFLAKEGKKQVDAEVIKEMIEEERKWEPAVSNDASLVPKWKLGIASSLNHAQNTIDELSSALSSGIKSSQTAWKDETNARTWMKKTADALSASVQSVSDIVSEGCLNEIHMPNSEKKEIINVVSDVQVNRVNSLSFKTSDALTEMDAKQKKVVDALSEYVEHIGKEHDGVAHVDKLEESDDDDSTIEEIMRLQHEIMEKQKEQIALLTNCVESTPNFVKDQTIELEDEGKEEETKYSEFEELSKRSKGKRTPKYVSKEICDDDLFRSVRAKKYSFDLSNENEDNEVNEIVARNHVSEIFDKWNEGCGTLTEFRDPKVILEEIKLLNEESENAQKEISQREYESRNAKIINEKRRSQIEEMKNKIEEHKKSISAKKDQYESIVKKLLYNTNKEREFSTMEECIKEIESIDKEKEAVVNDIAAQKAAIKAQNKKN